MECKDGLRICVDEREDLVRWKRLERFKAERIGVVDGGLGRPRSTHASGEVLMVLPPFALEGGDCTKTAWTFLDRVDTSCMSDEAMSDISFLHTQEAKLGDGAG